MNRSIFTIGIMFVSLFLFRCNKECTGISPELSEDDRKWVSLLSLNDSVSFKNGNDSSKTYYVVKKYFGKELHKGGGKALTSQCSDYDTPFGNITYSRIKNAENSDSIFFNVEVSRSEPTNTTTTMVRVYTPFDDFHFYQFTKNLGAYMVNGKMYNDVYYYERDTTGLLTNNYPDLIQKIYYSREAGLIRYDFTNNEVWERKEL